MDYMRDRDSGALCDASETQARRRNCPLRYVANLQSSERRQGVAKTRRSTQTTKNRFLTFKLDVSCDSCHSNLFYFNKKVCAVFRTERSKLPYLLT